MTESEQTVHSLFLSVFLPAGGEKNSEFRILKFWEDLGIPNTEYRKSKNSLRYGFLMSKIPRIQKINRFEELFENSIFTPQGVTKWKNFSFSDSYDYGVNFHSPLQL